MRKSLFKNADRKISWLPVYRKTIRLLATAILLVQASLLATRADIVISTSSSTASLAFAANISATDLINAGQTTLASATLPASHGSFPSSGLNDGAGNTSVPGGNVFLDTPAHLPATATFDLDVTSNTNGYTLTSIRSLAGWANASQSQANQKYDVFFKTAGATVYTFLTNVTYSPFPTTDGTAYETQVAITNVGGVLAAGVVSVQFVFQTPTFSGGNFPGTVYREVDVTGYLSVTNPPTVTTFLLSLPKTRQIVQRSSSNTAPLILQGTSSSTATNVARVEARAVVMPGTTNNGVSTDWVSIANAPTNGAYSGVISNLTAGGWYRIEVRAMDAATNVLATNSVERVGVGDLFVTAGQSNAGSFGSPAQSPTDDRVSAYTLTASPSFTWKLAVDPQPNISGFVGVNGSAWPALGSRLVASNQVPVGFIGLAYGATTVAQWAPGTGNYLNLTNALVRLGTNGVRAVLWHQGESDSLAPTTATAYAQQLTNIIARSRLAAGWNVPWGIAEATYHPSANRASEEAVAAGQRLALFTLTNCFRGPRTDDFSLENKISAHDGAWVHFNATGLNDHAQQWANALCCVEHLTPKNGDFEANIPLADGATFFTNRTIGWNRLARTGQGIASGDNGYFNPGLTTYSNAVDTINGGVLPNMSGKHVGTLQASVVSNSFQQTLTAHLQPSTIYTFSAAIGVRDNAATFGGYRLDILTNGIPINSGVSGDLAALNALAGGDATGKFTVVSCAYTSSVPVPTNQQLAIQITKPGGNGTYLDFDNVQVTSQLTGYGLWQMTNWGSVYADASLPGADEDADGLPNLIEHLVAGMNPAAHDFVPLPAMVSVSGEDYLELLLNKTPPPVSGSVGLMASYDLLNWFAPSNTSDVILQDDATQYRVQLRRSAIPQSYFRITARLP